MAGRKEYSLLFKLKAALGSNFNGSFKKAISTTKKLQNSMCDIHKVQNNVSSYQKQETVIEQNRKRLALLNEEHDKLQKELKETEQPSESLRKKFQKNEKQIAATTSKISEQREKLDTLGTELKEAGVNTGNLSGENKKLAQSYSKLKDQQQHFAKLNQQIAENKKKTSDLRRTFVKEVAVGGVAVAGFCKGFIKPSADLEEQMSVVKALSGANGEEMEQLTALAKKMGGTTKFTAIEAGKALEYMGQASWKANDMISGLPGIMNLSAASGEDLGAVSDIVTDALTAFGMKANESGRFADVLAVASTNANTNVAMMGETFKYVAPAAGNMKFTIEDTAVAIGLMASSGIKAGDAGTSLRSSLLRLAKPPKETAEAMKALNLSVVNSDGSYKSFGKILETLRGKFSDLTDEQKMQYSTMIAGKTGSSGFLAMINASDADFQKLSDSINDSSGAAERMAAIRMDNLNGDIILAKSSWNALSTTIGDLFNVNMRETIKGIRETTGKMNAWVQEHPKLAKGIISVVGALGALTIAITTIKLVMALWQGAFFKLERKMLAYVIENGVASSATVAWNAIAGVAATVTSALGAAFAFLTSPIGLTIAAIAAVIAIVVLCVKHWDSVKVAAISAWEKTKEVWGGAVKWFFGIFDGIKNAANMGLTFVENKINSFIGGINKCINLINKIPGVDIGELGEISIPKFAKGTKNTPDTFIAGENGPELITNASGRAVYTARETNGIFEKLKGAVAAARSVVATGLNPQAQFTFAGAGAPNVAAASVINRNSRANSIVIHSTPVFHIGKETDTSEIEKVLKKRDEELLNEVDERMKQKEEDERRQTYD